MEDTFYNELQLGSDRNICFFGIYDGHGGSTTSEYLSNSLHKNLAAIVNESENMVDALKKTYSFTDAELLNYAITNKLFCGSTAISLLVMPNDEKG